MTPLDVLWLFFILSSLQPALHQRALALQRTRAAGVGKAGGVEGDHPDPPT
jgi:hypothetical protein